MFFLNFWLDLCSPGCFSVCVVGVETERLSTKSLLNLASKTNVGPMLKHG